MESNFVFLIFFWGHFRQNRNLMFGLRLRHFLFTLPQGVAAVPKWSQHHKNHQTPRPCTSTREFDVSLDCVRLSGLALSCPKKVRAGRVSTIFLCSSACHARATTCAHPNNPGQRSLSPLDGVSKPKSDLGAVLKDHFFGGASHDSLVSASDAQHFSHGRSVGPVAFFQCG